MGNEKYRNSTTLSTLLAEVRMVKWDILNICLVVKTIDVTCVWVKNWQSYKGMENNKMLNRRQEIMSVCRHRFVIKAWDKFKTVTNLLMIQISRPSE